MDWTAHLNNFLPSADAGDPDAGTVLLKINRFEASVTRSRGPDVWILEFQDLKGQYQPSAD